MFWRISVTLLAPLPAATLPTSYFWSPSGTPATAVTLHGLVFLAWNTLPSDLHVASSPRPWSRWSNITFSVISSFYSIFMIPLIHFWFFLICKYVITYNIFIFLMFFISFWSPLHQNVSFIRHRSLFSFTDTSKMSRIVPEI